MADKIISTITVLGEEYQIADPVARQSLLSKMEAVNLLPDGLVFTDEKGMMQVLSKADYENELQQKILNYVLNYINVEATWDDGTAKYRF